MSNKRREEMNKICVRLLLTYNIIIKYNIYIIIIHIILSGSHENWTMLFLESESIYRY